MDIAHQSVVDQIAGSWGNPHIRRKRTPKARAYPAVHLLLQNGASGAKLSKALRRPNNLSRDEEAGEMQATKEGMLEIKSVEKENLYKKTRKEFIRGVHPESNCPYGSDINQLIYEGDSQDLNARCNGVGQGRLVIDGLEDGAGERVIHEDQRCVIVAACGKLVSDIHLICVPKSKYIYNAVTLDAMEDLALVRHMRHALKEAVFEICTQRKPFERYLKHLEEGVRSLGTRETRIMRPWKQQDTGKMSEEEIKDFISTIRTRITAFARKGSLRTKISAAVQAHPKARMGLFHMHGFIPSTELVTLAGRSLLDDFIPIESVLRVLEEEKKLILAQML